MAQHGLSLMRRPSVPLHVEVADLFRNQILAGDLPSGTRLPSINELNEDMRLARMTVRQAMATLEAEGMIDRQPGRGTFVKDIGVRRRQFLRMEADLDQLFRTVDGLKVAIATPDGIESPSSSEGPHVKFTRLHVLEGEPFCVARLRIERSVYEQAPERFSAEVAILVLRDLGVPVSTARQRVVVTYADAEVADMLKVHINSPLMWVRREFFGADGGCIYSAELTYPSESLGFEVEFKV